MKTIQTDGFLNDIAGQLAYLRLPDFLGRRAHKFQIRAVGTNNGAAASFTDLVEYVSFVFGEVEKIRIDPVMHLALANHLNTSGDSLRSDTLSIDFSTIATTKSPIGFAGQEMPKIYVKLKSDAGNVAHDHLECVAHYDSLSSPEPVGFMYRQIEFVDTDAINTDWNNVTDLPVSELGSVAQILIESAHVTNIEIFLGDEKFWAVKREHIDGMQREDPLIKAQGIANRLILDFERFRTAARGLDLSIGALKLRYLHDSAQNIPAGGIKMLVRGIQNVA